MGKEYFETSSFCFVIYFVNNQLVIANVLKFVEKLETVFLGSSVWSILVLHRLLIKSETK